MLLRCTLEVLDPHEVIHDQRLLLLREVKYVCKSQAYFFCDRLARDQRLDTLLELDDHKLVLLQLREDLACRPLEDRTHLMSLKAKEAAQQKVREVSRGPYLPCSGVVAFAAICRVGPVWLTFHVILFGLVMGGACLTGAHHCLCRV